MLKHLEKRRQKNEEEGFTLIELMVVVLIMGILMAIAIPTFLSTRGSANDASAKSNATNAYTNEKSFYSANVFFEPANATDNGSSLDSTLPWGTALGQVAAYTDAGTSPQQVEIVAGSKSGACFYIMDVETSGGNGTAYIGYAELTGETTCPTPGAGFTAITPSATVFPSTGTAAANTGTAGASAAPTVFYPSWT